MPASSFPGVGLLDFLLNPLVVRAFSRKQELEADQRTVEILRAWAIRRRAGALPTRSAPLRGAGQRRRKARARWTPAIAERPSALGPGTDARLEARSSR